MSDRRPPSTTTPEPVYPTRLLVYIGFVAVGAVLLGVFTWFEAPHPPLAPLLLLCFMGVLSYNLREPDVGSRVGFSFLSIILLSSAVIVGPFGAWIVGVASVAIDRQGR